MWEGIDPELRRQYDSLRTMVRLSHQSPAREWIYLDYRVG